MQSKTNLNRFSLFSDWRHGKSTHNFFILQKLAEPSQRTFCSKHLNAVTKSSSNAIDSDQWYGTVRNVGVTQSASV